MQLEPQSGLAPQLGYQEIGPVSAALLFLYVGTFFLQAGSRIDFLGEIRFEFIVAAVLLCLAVAKTISNKPPRSPLLVPVVIFVLLVAIQVPLSIDVDYSWEVFVDRFLKFSAMGFIIATFGSSPFGMKVFVVAFLLSCAKMGQEGLVGNITGSMIWENQGIMRLHGSTGMYEHPNSFAGMALGTVPFIVFLFPLANKYLKAALLVMGVFAANIAVYSGSRTAYLGVIAFSAYVLKHVRRRGPAIFCVFVAAILIVSLVPEDYKERFESIFTGEEKEGRSSEARIHVFEDSVVIFVENPFGVGVSAFPIARMQKFGRKQDTHNLYMEVATNLGIQGLVAFLLLILVLMRTLRRLRDSFRLQCERVEQLCCDLPETVAACVKRHCDDLRFFEAMTKVALTYIFIRLVVGLFGHDLYEIYWWVGTGFAIALFRCNVVAQRKTKDLMARAANQDSNKAIEYLEHRGRLS